MEYKNATANESGPPEGNLVVWQGTVRALDRSLYPDSPYRIVIELIEGRDYERGELEPGMYDMILKRKA